MDGYRKKWPEHLCVNNSEKRYREKQQEETRRKKERRIKRETPPEGKIQEHMCNIYAGIKEGKKFYRTGTSSLKFCFISKEDATKLDEVPSLYEDIILFIKESIKKYRRHIGSCRSRDEIKTIYFENIEDAKKAEELIKNFLNENLTL